MSIAVLFTACAGDDPQDDSALGTAGNQSTSAPDPTQPMMPAGTSAPTSTAPTSTVPTTPAPTSTVPTTPAPTSTVPTTPAPDPADVPSWGEMYYRINLTCANAVCHVPLYFPPDLSDSMDDLYDVLTTRTVPQCGDSLLVVPGDPANSAILQVVNGDCGDFLMPFDCKTAPCIAEDTIESLTIWIAAGAPGPN